jgi:hypothetical protein
MRAAMSIIKRLRDLYQRLVIAAPLSALALTIDLAMGGRLWFQCVVLGFVVAPAFTALDTLGLKMVWLGRARQARKMREYPERQCG